MQGGEVIVRSGSRGERGGDNLAEEAVCAAVNRRLPPDKRLMYSFGDE